MEIMRGQCLCGKIEFEIFGAFPKLYQCHCSLCRKQGGSASNTALMVSAGNFRWVSGADGISSYVKETGFRSDFCSTCGSPVPNPLKKTSYMWVPAGSLDDSAQLEVAAHIFVGSKASWDIISARGEQHDTMPELSEFIEFLKSPENI